MSFETGKSKKSSCAHADDLISLKKLHCAERKAWLQASKSSFCRPCMKRKQEKAD